MCGRYTLTVSAEQLQHAFGLERLPATHPRYNIAPHQAAPIIVAGLTRELVFARWGLLPKWAKSEKVASKMINARAETLREKPAFKPLLADHRCLVPCTGFFEWRPVGRRKQPIYIRPTHADHVMAMAGLWSTWQTPEHQPLMTYTVITTGPNALVQPIHDRMPVFLDHEGQQRWLSGKAHDLDALTDLLKPWHGEPMEALEVDPIVNSVATDSPKCIERYRANQLSLL
jgi:putative SOS response-associated peptidase YedK